MLNSLSVISENINEILPAISASSETTARLVMNELERKATGLGTVTFEGLNERLKSTVVEVLTDSGVINSTTNTQLEDSNNNNQITEDNQDNIQLFLYDGSYRVPQSFNLNGIDGKSVWHFGLPQQHICPFKGLPGKDMPNKNMAKRLSDLKRFIQKLNHQATIIGIPIIPSTVIECNAHYDDIIRELSNGRHGRSLYHLAWRSINDVI